VNKILVAIDFSENSYRSLDAAVNMAKKLGASVTVLNVVYPPSFEVSSELPLPWDETVVSDWKKINEQALIKLAKKTQEHNSGLEISYLMREGQPASVIVEVAKDYDFIFIGKRGRALPDVLMGSISDRVAHMSNCPIVIVP
jgi:nucleotide-binding universal stress UspA family protein